MAMTTVFLASCSACEACSGNTKVSFKDYYLSDANHAVSEVNETLSYDVVHEGNNSYNGYKINYANGTYTTTLTKNKDNKDTPFNESETYTLVSKFSIDVTYEFNGTSVEFTDTTNASVIFYAAKNSLQPLSSQKTVYSHSPSQNTPSKIEDCYTEYHQTITTEYNDACTGGKTTVVNHKFPNSQPDVQNFEIEDADKYTYLDNEQLLFALRCMTPTTSGKVQIYSPFVKSVQTIKTVFGSANTSQFHLKLNGATEKQTYEISYLPVNVDLEAKHNGATQEVWIAETLNITNNEYRNVMLQYTTPLPFNLGKLQYKLVSANFTK